MGLRLFHLFRSLNYSLNNNTYRHESIANFVKFSTARGLRNRIKVIKPDLNAEDEIENCKSKNKENKKMERRKRVAVNVVNPPIDEKTMKKLQTVVGMHIGPCSIYWAKIQRHGNVLDWSHRKLFPITEMSRKIQLPKLYEEISSFLEYIPVGDVYILEAANHVQPNSMQSSSPSASASAILRAQILAMLVALLNCKVDSDISSDSYEDFNEEFDNIHKVYFLRPRIMSRLFHLLVGTERVSAIDLVDSILDGTKNYKMTISDVLHNTKEEENADKGKLHPGPIFTPVKVPSTIADSYHRLRAVEKEEMCQALLVAMTFYDLVIFKDPKVLAPLQM